MLAVVGPDLERAEVDSAVDSSALVTDCRAMSMLSRMVRPVSRSPSVQAIDGIAAALPVFRRRARPLVTTVSTAGLKSTQAVYAATRTRPHPAGRAAAGIDRRRRTTTVSPGFVRPSSPTPSITPTSASRSAAAGTSSPSPPTPSPAPSPLPSNSPMTSRSATSPSVRPSRASNRNASRGSGPPDALVPAGELLARPVRTQMAAWSRSPGVRQLRATAGRANPRPGA